MNSKTSIMKCAEGHAGAMKFPTLSLNNSAMSRSAARDGIPGSEGPSWSRRAVKDILLAF